MFNPLQEGKDFFSNLGGKVPQGGSNETFGVETLPYNTNETFRAETLPHFNKDVRTDSMQEGPFKETIERLAELAKGEKRIDTKETLNESKSSFSDWINPGNYGGSTANAPQAGGIGYNLAKAYNMMEEIANKYIALGNYISEEWPSIKNALRINWVGPDEQGYEEILVKKIVDCYGKATLLAQNAINRIQAYALDWVEKQKANTMTTGSASAQDFLATILSSGVYKRIVEGIKLQPIDPIITFEKIAQYAEDTNFGLMSDNSAMTVQSVIETFVQKVQQKTSNVFINIATDQAFFGEQKGAVRGFIESVSRTLGVVATAIKDLYEVLNQVAKTNYQNMQSQGMDALSRGASQIEQEVNELGSSRWG